MWEEQPVSRQNGTVRYQRSHSRGLTLPQESALDLLAGGKTDRETAELLGLARPTISRWRLYDPVFAAALNQRRAEIWGAAADRLRALVPEALDALADALKKADPTNRLKAASEILRLAPLPVGPRHVGPTDAHEIR